MKIRKTWGKEVWEEKIKKQSPEQVVGGFSINQENLKKYTDNVISILDRNVFPLIKKNERIMDVGIGPMARFALEFARRGYDVVGIDVSPTTLKFARKVIADEGFSKKIKLMELDMDYINLKEKVMLIFCYATFYHIPSYLALDTLKVFNKNLKKNGFAFIQFGLKENECRLKRKIFKMFWFLGHHIYKKIKRNDFLVTISYFNKDEIEDMISKAGFRIIKSWGDTYFVKK